MSTESHADVDRYQLEDGASHTAKRRRRRSMIDAGSGSSHAQLTSSDGSVGVSSRACSHCTAQFDVAMQFKTTYKQQTDAVRMEEERPVMSPSRSTARRQVTHDSSVVCCVHGASWTAGRARFPAAPCQCIRWLSHGPGLPNSRV